MTQPSRKQAFTLFGLASAGLVGALALAGCEIGYLDGERYTASQKLGGVRVSAETLNDGYEAYMLYCYACHGEKGDGNGPSARGLRPPPRNFQKAIFKFAGAPIGGIPSDEDLDRIIRYGLNGTPMLAWDIPERERKAIIQYIKTFRSESDVAGLKKDPKYKVRNPWHSKRQSPAFTPKTPDPYGPSRTREAVALGKLVYHAVAQCQSCHPAYLTTAEFQSLADDAKAAGLPPAQVAPRDDAYNPQGKYSDEYKVTLLPPDFTRHPVRSVRIDCPGGAHGVCEDEMRLGDFYRIVTSGIPGAAMPPFSLEPNQLWALVHYVKWLHDKHLEGGDAAELRRVLTSQPPFVPPPAPAPAPSPAPEGATPAPAPEGAAPAGTAPAPAPEGAAPAPKPAGNP